MMYIFIFSLLIISLLQTVLSESTEEISDSNFNDRVGEVETALVMFYAPWCGHCKKLKPEFEKAAGILLKNDPPVHLMKVDCTEAGKDTCGKFSVTGYPTLKIFRGADSNEEYNGPRDSDGIVKYMKSKVGPASKSFSSQAELDAFLAKAEAVVVVSYLSSAGDQAVFNRVASKLNENVDFADYAGGEIGKVVLYRPTHLHSKLEDIKVTYEGKLDGKLLETWIRDNYHGFAGHRTRGNADMFKYPLVIAYYNVDYIKNIKGTNYWRNRLMRVAKNYHPQINFAISNVDDFAQEALEFGLEVHMAKDKPLVVLKDANSMKYVMSEEFSVDNVEAFIVKYQNGNIEPYLKSEDLPEGNDKLPVKIAVAKNFDELVTKSEKDVLVEFYAPWCGHCKQLAPIYEKLGTKMMNEDVEIVKMDATANDVPAGYDVRGFPTLYWLPSNTKKPVSYDGGRDIKDFIKYISKHASKELKGYKRNGKAKKEEL